MGRKRDDTTMPRHLRRTEPTRTSDVMRRASRNVASADSLLLLRRPLFSATHTGRLKAQRMCEVGVAVGSLGVPMEESPSSAEQGAG